MLIRKNYLNQLIQSKDLNLIKVITGVRRSGKSTLLLQYKDYLVSQGIIEKNIIYNHLTLINKKIKSMKEDKSHEKLVGK